MLSRLLSVLFLLRLSDAKYKTGCITGEGGSTRLYATFYVDNWFEFYYNGEFVYRDTTTYMPHNGARFAFNLCGRKHYFAIRAHDAGDDVTGLEYFDRCIGDGGMKFKFETEGWETGNVLLTSNATWGCKAHHFGPVNWEDCYSKHRVIGQFQQGGDSNAVYPSIPTGGHGDDNFWLPNCRNKPTVKWTYNEDFGNCTAPDYDSLTDADFAANAIDLGVDGSDEDCTPERTACFVWSQELPDDWYSPKEKTISRDPAYVFSEDQVGWGKSPIGCSLTDQGGHSKEKYTDMDHYFCNPFTEYNETSTGLSGRVCPNYGTGESGSAGYGNGNFDSPSGKIDGTENGNGPYLVVKPEWAPTKEYYMPFNTYYNEYWNDTGTDKVDGVSSYHDLDQCFSTQIDSTLGGVFGVFDASENPIGGSNDCICKGPVNWENAPFIWTRSLRFDNRITCALRFFTPSGYHRNGGDILFA